MVHGERALRKRSSYSFSIMYLQVVPSVPLCLYRDSHGESNKVLRLLWFLHHRLCQSHFGPRVLYQVVERTVAVSEGWVYWLLRSPYLLR